MPTVPTSFANGRGVDGAGRGTMPRWAADRTARSSRCCARSARRTRRAGESRTIAFTITNTAIVTGEEAGFSLIELIIVVVVLGILVAIAIPIFGGIQASAQTNTLKAAAANGAMAASAALSETPAGDPADAAEKNSKDGIRVAVEGTPTKIEDVCVSAEKDGETWYAGQGAAADGKSCTGTTP